MKNANILIIGSGISGLSSALKLLNAGHKVTIWSKESSELEPSTSVNAYAIWVPVKIDADPRVERWTNESFVELSKLARVPGTGIEIRSVFQLKPARSEPWFAATVPGVRHALPSEISADYADAHVINAAPVVDPPTYLAWLRRQIRAKGGKLLTRTIQSFSECPAEFDVVLNCSGLGARTLANDSTLFPERVQVVKIKHNGFQHVVIDDEGAHKRACIVPHANYIKLGAVFDTGNESLTTDPACTRDILDRCKRMVPGFKADLADVISVSRALRPERPLTRVELDNFDGGRALIHNYGHDGMGYILSCGIAGELVGYVNSL